MVVLVNALCLVVSTLFLCKVTVGRKVEAAIITDKDWIFLARFCFLSEQGALFYHFYYPVSHGTQEILLYYDDPGQWESVYRSTLNCSARRSVVSEENNQIISLTTYISTTSARFSGCVAVTQAGKQYYNCTGGRTFRSARERWWYIAVARCTPAFDYGVTGLNLDYKLHMTNGEEGDFWHYEYSADEFYILIEDIVYLVVYVILMILSIICAVVLRGKQLFHSTYKIYMAALSLWLFGLLLLCIGWGQYGSTGWQQKPTEVTGRLFQAASNIFFILMLILLAKGFSVTRGKLPHMSIVRVFGFFICFTLVYTSLFIWEGLFFDEGTVLYFYESPPGYGLVAMRLVGWLWFLYAIFFTIKHHPNKGNFYFPFLVFYTFWFWAGPIIILVAMFAMPKWSREKMVNGVEQFVAVCGHLFFLILTRPSAANKNFPYHVRTSQIATIFDPEENARNPGISTYRLNPNDEIFMPEETHQHVTGPNLAALFVVQDASAKSLHDENKNTSPAAPLVDCAFPAPLVTAKTPSQAIDLPSQKVLSSSAMDLPSQKVLSSSATDLPSQATALSSEKGPFLQSVEGPFVAPLLHRRTELFLQPINESAATESHIVPSAPDTEAIKDSARINMFLAVGR